MKKRWAFTGGIFGIVTYFLLMVFGIFMVLLSGGYLFRIEMPSILYYVSIYTADIFSFLPSYILLSWHSGATLFYLLIFIYSVAFLIFSLIYLTKSLKVTSIAMKGEAEFKKQSKLYIKNNIYFWGSFVFLFICCIFYWIINSTTLAFWVFILFTTLSFAVALFTLIELFIKPERDVFVNIDTSNIEKKQAEINSKKK